MKKGEGVALVLVLVLGMGMVLVLVPVLVLVLVLLTTCCVLIQCGRMWQCCVCMCGGVILGSGLAIAPRLQFHVFFVH
jgi:hypothetical protein